MPCLLNMQLLVECVLRGQLYGTSGNNTSSKTSIPYQRARLSSISLLTCLRKKHTMAQNTWCLLSSWHFWIEFMPPGFSLVQLMLLWLRSKAAMENCSLSPSLALCHCAFQVNLLRGRKKEEEERKKNLFYRTIC